MHAAANSELAENYYLVSSESQLGGTDKTCASSARLSFVQELLHAPQKSSQKIALYRFSKVFMKSFRATFAVFTMLCSLALLVIMTIKLQAENALLHDELRSLKSFVL